MPSLITFDKSHCSSLTPPSIDLTWCGHPQIPILPQFDEIAKELFIDLQRSRSSHVVGMHNETHQPVFAKNKLHLLLPNVDRVIAQDVK